MAHAIGPFGAIIFDMDGVLLDTEPLYHRAMTESCAVLGYEVPDALHKAQIGIPVDAGNKMMAAHFGPEFPLARYIEMTAKNMQAQVAENIPVKTGVRELLAELNSRDIPVAVATSTGSPIAPDRLRQTGLFDHFSAVVTRSDVSNGKPHPELFLTAAARIGVDPTKCIALEDSHNGIRAAHGAGMRPIMVPDLLDPTAEIEALCFAIMPSLHHVREALFLNEALAE